MTGCLVLVLVLVLSAVPAQPSTSSHGSSVIASTVGAGSHSGAVFDALSAVGDRELLLGEQCVRSLANSLYRNDALRRFHPGPGCYIVPSLMLAVFAVGFILADRKRRARIRVQCPHCGYEMTARRSTPNDSVKCKVCGHDFSLVDENVRAIEHKSIDDESELRIQCPRCGVEMRIARDFAADTVTCNLCGYNYPIRDENIRNAYLAAGASEEEIDRLSHLTRSGEFEALLCPSCSSLSTTSETKCQACGYLIRKICHGCGKMFDVRKTSCPRCGARFEGFSGKSSADYQDLEPDTD